MRLLRNNFFFSLLFRLFQEDVKQVLDWLTNHGEVFIRKNTGVGRNLQKARVYQKSHEHFENVAQVNDNEVNSFIKFNFYILINET